jgi:DNA-binding ferritin-like protein
VVSERMIRRRRELKKEEFLADVFAVYLKTKNFHWHASVPHFRETIRYSMSRASRSLP